MSILPAWAQRRGLAGMFGGALLVFQYAVQIGMGVNVKAPSKDASASIVFAIAILAATACLIWAVAGLYAGQTNVRSRIVMVLFFVVGAALVGLQGIVAIGLLGNGVRTQDQRLKKIMLPLGALGFIAAFPVVFWELVLQIDPIWLQVGMLLYGAGWMALGWLLWLADSAQVQAPAAA